eukprot:3006032-Rhodomonas_salina.2
MPHMAMKMRIVFKKRILVFTCITAAEKQVGRGSSGEVSGYELSAAARANLMSEQDTSGCENESEDDLMLRLFTSQPAFKLLSDDAEKRGMRAEREVLSNSLHGAAMQIQSRGADMSVSRALCESVLTATERVPAPERQRVLESLAVAMVASLRGHMHSFSSETAQAIYDVMSPSLIPTMAVTKTPPPPLWPMTMRRVVLQTTGPLTAPSTNWVWGWVDSSCFSEKGADFET